MKYSVASKTLYLVQSKVVAVKCTCMNAGTCSVDLQPVCAVHSHMFAFTSKNPRVLVSTIKTFVELCIVFPEGGGFFRTRRLFVTA